MTYTQEREEFIAAMALAGHKVWISREILAAANKLQKLAELGCSSERADKDQVPCPALRGKECLCLGYGNFKDHRSFVTTCGACQKAWCGQCDPAPSALCHYCHGRGASTHPVKDQTNLLCSHGTVPRYMVKEARIEAQVRALCEARSILVSFNGDPRGCVVHVTLPDARDLGVPSKGYSAAEMERICG